MTIDPTREPTREEWLEERANLCTDLSFSRDMAHRVLHIIFGPCPPEPAPPRWHLDSLEVSGQCSTDRGVWVGFVDKWHKKLTPNEARAMAESLIEHADYARGQEVKEPEPCGRVLVGQGTDTSDPICVRPKGHPGVCCHDGWTHGDHAREQQVARNVARVIDAIGPVCGRVLDRKPSDTSAKVCQRPKGHDGSCSPEERTAPKVAPQPL